MAEAQAAGFEHVNLDLIYGAPYETDADWQRSLDAAIGTDADHISAYALVVEKGTALARQVDAGVVPAPDDDVMADRYVMADETLRAAGSTWYEVSNWATSDAARCRHNELYWSDANWWGLGRARTATSAACAGGTSSTRCATRRWSRRPQPGGRPRDAGRGRPLHRAGDARRADARRIADRRAHRAGARPLPQLAGWGLVDRAQRPTAGSC